MIVFMIISVFISAITASSGDRLPEFRQCKYSCNKACPESPPIPLVLQLTLWNCESECDYTCMNIVSDGHQTKGAKIHQYHGKWPFERILGIQEPASVIFSLFNGYYHYRGLQKYLKLPGTNQHVYRSILILYGTSAVNLWFWSAVFHTRDFPFTEKV
jgi:hypothetical protein